MQSIIVTQFEPLLLGYWENNFLFVEFLQNSILHPIFPVFIRLTPPIVCLLSPQGAHWSLVWSLKELMQTYSPCGLISTPPAGKITQELLNPTQLIVFWLFLSHPVTILLFRINSSIFGPINRHRWHPKRTSSAKKSELKTLRNF
jgi:hypothetical protein